MGGSSSTLSSTQVNTFMQQQTMNFANSTTQNVHAHGSIAQTINLAKSRFDGCRIAAVNKGQLTVQSEGKLSTQSTAALTSALSAAANNAIQQASTQSNGWLATGSNSTNQTQNIQNSVSSIINTTINNSTVQDILSQASGTQLTDGSGMTMTCDPKYRLPGPCGPDGSSGCDFMFNNDILVSAAAKGIADAVTSALSDSSVTGSFINKGGQTSDQKNGGIPLPDINIVFIACAIIFILLCCCCCGGIMLLFMSKS
jgi:hypothetical protein